MTTNPLSLENQPLLSIPSQPTGKYRWLIGSVVTLGGTIGVGTVSVQNFIAGAVLNGGILGAGSLICAGACAYCLYRFVDALRTRNIEPIGPIFDESAAKVNFLVLRAVYNQINTLLNKGMSIDLEEVIDDERLPNSIQQQVTELEKILLIKRQEFIDSQDMKFRLIETFNPVIKMSEPNGNALMLQTIHNRLSLLLEQDSIFDHEEGVDEERLHEVINAQLTNLEDLLPNMREELDEFQKIVETGLGNRSMGSASMSALNSPSADSLDRGLFAKLDALAKKVARESSRSASRTHSSYSSPIINGNKSGSVVSPIVKPIRKLDLNATINASDSDDI